MLLALGFHERAQRDDLHALLARVLHDARGEKATDALTAKDIRDGGVVGGDELRTGVAVDELRLRVDTVDSGDIAALGRAILALADDAALRARLGAEGRRRFTDPFRQETMTDRLRALYARLRAGGPVAEPGMVVVR